MTCATMVLSTVDVTWSYTSGCNSECICVYWIPFKVYYYTILVECTFFKCKVRIWYEHHIGYKLKLSHVFHLLPFIYIYEYM